MDLLRHVRIIIFAIVWVFMLNLIRVPAYSFWWFASLLVAWYIFDFIEKFRDGFCGGEK
jgi:hypothetical protein